jgi:hypothetical protein
VAYGVVAWLYVGAIGVQFFFAGLGIFAGPLNWETHTRFGFGIGLLLPILLVLAFLGKVPRGIVLWLVVLIADYIIQSSLPALRDVSPFLAALHPVNALLVFTIALVHALRATRFVRAPQHPEITTYPSPLGTPQAFKP